MTTISKKSATIMIVSSTLGSGILFMPASFNQLGYLTAWIVVAMIGLLNWYSIYSLSYAAESAKGDKEQTYSSVAEMFSKKLKLVVDLTFSISNLGTCFIFLRRAAKYSSILICQILPKSVDSEICRKVVLALLSIFSFRMLLLESLSSLSPLSYLSMFSALYYLGLMISLGIFKGKPFEEIKAVNLEGRYDFAVSLMLFAMHCQFSFLEIRHIMSDRSMRSVSKVATFAIAIVVCLYGSAGFFGYKAAGKELYDKMILDLIIESPSENPFLHFSQNKESETVILYAFKLLLVAFCVIFTVGVTCCAFPTIPVFENLLSFEQFRPKRTYIVLALIVGLFLPNLYGDKDINPDSILDLVSTFCTNPLSFFFPALFMILASKNSAYRIFSFLSISISVGIMALKVYKLTMGKKED